MKTKSEMLAEIRGLMQESPLTSIHLKHIMMLSTLYVMEVLLDEQKLEVSECKANEKAVISHCMEM